VIVLPSGGPVAFFYGFIFCVLCNFCIAASMGEMASVWPTAGGQYHWAYALSADSWKNSMVRFLAVSQIAENTDSKQSFLVGWINIAGWLTLITTEAIFGCMSRLMKWYAVVADAIVALMLSAAAVAGSGFTFAIQPWMTYLFFLAISLFAILLNIFGYRILGRWNEGARKLHAGQ
jgi:amino acid transporter